METFYSILYISTLPTIDEQVSIGLFFIKDGQIIFNYSIDKLKIIRKLISEENFYLVKSYLTKIKNDIDNIQKTITENLLIFGNKIENTYRNDVFSYLSRYNNNLIRFSKPIYIELKITEENYRNLYNKLITNKINTKINNTNAAEIDKEKEIFYSKIEKKVNTNILFSDLKILNFDEPDVFYPNKINIIGKNGQYVTGQFFDFDTNETSIELSINKYRSFVKSIYESDNNEINNSHYYIIGDEPNKINRKQHNLWEQLRNYKLFKYHSFDEKDEIIDYINNNDVKPIVNK